MRISLMTGTVACSCGIAAATDSAFVAPQQVRYDAYSALAFAAESLEETEVPTTKRIDLYVSQSGLSKFRVRTVRYAIDEAASQTAELPEPDGKAVAARDELRRLGRIAGAAGAHRLHAEATIVSTGKPDAEPVVVTTEQPFEKTDDLLSLELRLDSGTLGGLRLRAHQWRPSHLAERKLLGVAVNRFNLPGAKELQYQVGSEADPALSYVRHLVSAGKIDQAFIELLRMQERADPAEPLAADFHLEMARELRKLGMLDRAQVICDDLDRQKQLASDVSVERLAIAEAFYAQGNLDRADAQLELARPAMPEFRVADWRYTRGMVLLAMGRPADAAELLGTTDSESIDAFRYMNASTEALRATAYGRYNLAVALVRSGDEKRGLSWLDLVGRAAPRDPELQNLRDQANLALGWHFLKQKQGRTAVGVLGRVVSEGLAADRALLGMGWAQLAPDGERLPRVQLGVDAPRAPDQINDLPAPIKNSLARLRVIEPELHGVVGPRSFEREDPPKNREEGLHRALAIWNVLVQRDERDDAVLEGLLAKGYVQDQLHDTHAARAAYAEAIAALKRVQVGISASAVAVDDGALPRRLAEPGSEDALFSLMEQLHLPPGEPSSPLYIALDWLRENHRLLLALADSEQKLFALAALSSGSGAAGEGRSAQERLRAASGEIDMIRPMIEHDVIALMHDGIHQRATAVDTYLKSALLLAARVQDQPELDKRENETVSQR